MKNSIGVFLVIVAGIVTLASAGCSSPDTRPTKEPPIHEKVLQDRKTTNGQGKTLVVSLRQDPDGKLKIVLSIPVSDYVDLRQKDLKVTAFSTNGQNSIIQGQSPPDATVGYVSLGHG